MSIGAMSTAIQGLNAAQRQLETISLNVSNASTPGYTRKTLLQTTTTVAGVGSGVQTGQLQRTVNSSLQNDLWRQSSRASSTEVEESYLLRIQQLFGTPDSQQSFAAAMSKMKSGFIALSSDPSNGVIQSEVVGYAQSLASKFNSLSNNIQSLRNSIQDQIGDNVTQINQLLENIASTNVAVASAVNRGDNPVDLMDQRDQYILKLTDYMDISIFNSSDGSIVVQTKNGSLLADKTAHTFTFDKTPMSYSTYYPATANGIKLDGIDVTSQMTSGSVGKLFEMRDTILPQAQAMVDEAAHKMALRFEVQGIRLFTNAAGTVPTNVVANYVGFSALIVVNPAVVSDPSLLKDGTGGGPPLNASDNANILKVLDYALGEYADASGTAHAAFRTTSLGANGSLTITLPAGGNIVSYANTLIATQAQQYSQALTQKEYETGYRDTLSKKMQDETGVSIDAEMASMITIQKGYAACARAISAVSEMFDTLLKSF